MPVTADAWGEVPGNRRLPASKRLLAALSDERLANRLRQGDDAAFELLYDRHHGGLLGLCRHMLRSHEEAEDAVQQAFLSAYRAITENGDRPVRVKPWLYSIGRNRCVSIIRSRRSAEGLTDGAGGTTSGPSDEAEQREELRALVEDVRKLPEAQRTALVLAELGGLAHPEVAEVLECRSSKVRSLVFQARSTLLEQREARGASCRGVREEIANLSGTRIHGRTRRHVKACPGCAAFHEQVRSQRRMLALVLPVAPSLGLKRSVLGAASGGGGAGGGGLAAGVALKTGAAGGAATGGGTVAGAAAGGGAFAGGGVLAAITGHAGLTKATAVALAAGSVAAGAKVAEETDPARPAAGAQERSGESRVRAGSGAEASRSSLPALPGKASRAEQAGPGNGRSERGGPPSDERARGSQAGPGNGHPERGGPPPGERSQGSERGHAAPPSDSASRDSHSGGPPASAGSSARTGSSSSRPEGPSRRRASSGREGKGSGRLARAAAPSGRRRASASDEAGAAIRSTKDAASQKLEKVKPLP